MNYTYRQPIDQWLKDYQPLRGRARMWHYVKNVCGLIVGLTVYTVVVLAGLAMGAVLMILLFGWL